MARDDMRPATLAEMEAMLTPEARARVEKLAAEIIAEEMSLAELRKVRSLTQSELAKRMGKSQTFISHIESQGDAYISTIRDHLKAMGGDLVIMAQFPDMAPVSISGFSDLQSAKLEPAQLEPATLATAKPKGVRIRAGLLVKRFKIGAGLKGTGVGNKPSVKPFGVRRPKVRKPIGRLKAASKAKHAAR